MLGWPHQQFGEVAVAFVVLNTETLSGEELIAYCSERLARHKLPGRILILSELPKNPMGKVVKDSLRETLSNGQKNASR